MPTNKPHARLAGLILAQLSLLSSSASLDQEPSEVSERDFLDELPVV
jgi:hypothetical protein